jgi:HPt (histidine-containing phosphotransfer) domain-containing protein
MDSLTLDSQMLIDLYGGSSEDARFILTDYLDKHPDIIDSFRKAFDAGVSALGQCAHRHSSSFSYIGMPQLTAACKEFEQDCKNAVTTTTIKTKFEKLLSLLDQSAVLVKQELERLKTA